MVRRQSFPSVGDGIAAVLAFAQLRLITLVLHPYEPSVLAAQGVLEGRPHWRIYQSRVLAPLMVQVLSHVLSTFLWAHVAFSIVSLTAAGMLAWRLGERQAGSRGAALALVVLHVGFSFVLSMPWLYAWDFLNLIVFLLFVDFVSEERPLGWFVSLSALGALNHEIAIFVALWLVVDSLIRWARGRAQGEKLAWRPVLTGAACATTSLAIVEALRSTLLIEEVGPKLFADAPKDAGRALHFTLWDNLGEVGRILSHPEYLSSLIVLPCLIVVGALGVALARAEPDKFTGLVVTYGMMLGSLLMFGVLLETRIYVVLIPLVVLAAVRLTSDRPGARAPRSGRAQRGARTRQADIEPSEA
jgi:hypothetical protein